MFFRNLTLFRFPSTFAGLFPTPVADVLEGMPAMLAAHTLKPVGALELASYGFVSPFGRGSDVLTHQVGRAVWLTLGGEERILPSAVVNDALARKLDEIQEREGHAPGGRARKRLREEIVHELLPKAFIKPVRLDAYLDLDRGFIAVDTPSRKKAEALVSHIRHAAGSFPALPLNAETAPRAVLTSWLAGEELPEGLNLGEDAELRDSGDDGRVAVRSVELRSEEVSQHLEVGRQCTRLALILDDHISFALGEDLVIRKLRFLDGAVDGMESAEDARAELDARFALMVGEVGRLFDLLQRALKFSSADEGAPPPDTDAGRARPDDGLTTVTISTPGGPSVTLTEEQFHKAARAAGRKRSKK